LLPRSAAQVAHVAELRSNSKKALDRDINASTLGRGSESRVLWFSVSPHAKADVSPADFVNVLAEIFPGFLAL
jgi:hypothetical protein